MQIPTDIYKSPLLCFLNPNNFENETDKSSVVLLHKICVANIIDETDPNYIGKLKLSDKERAIVLMNKWPDCENIEVKSRINDILRRYTKDKRQVTETASNGYYDLYTRSNRVGFLFRSITVRNIKVLNDTTFLSLVTSSICQGISPYWLNKLICALLKSYSIEQLSTLNNWIDSQLKQSLLSKEFDTVREYTHVQYSLKIIDTDNYHKLIASSFEQEADEMVNNKLPNTIYPRISETYQLAYNELFKTKNRDAIVVERIKSKLLRERTVFFDAMCSFGPTIRMSVPSEMKYHIDEFSKVITISNLTDAINIFVSIPFVSESSIDNYIKISRENSPLSSLMGTNHLNKRGNSIGIADHEVSLRTEAHIFSRQSRLYALWKYIDLIKWSEVEIEKNFVYALIYNIKPQFIDDDNIEIWVKGIVAGFLGDFISASHILMPQLEHALHNIVEFNNGTITLLEKQRQDEPTLGQILPMLNGVFCDTILFELSSFLQGGIDANFRNNLLHGLLTRYEIDKHGIYLWWICLKFVFTYKEIQSR